MIAARTYLLAAHSHSHRGGIAARNGSKDPMKQDPEPRSTL